MKALNTFTITEAAQWLAEGHGTSVELTRACLAAAKKNPELNVFITLAEDTALAAAAASDARRAAGKAASVLDGIPYVVKDSYCTAGIRTTAGSKMLDDFVPTYDAEVVTRLSAAGAVLLGKTNMDQFGHGGSTENSGYGPSKNPWDTTRVPGGSSGGSAVALAADMCIFAIGEDTGGSIRQPASFTNTTGLKVTYGRVSRWGSIAYASSLDTMGPMTKSVEDAALVLQVIAGHDPKDATSSKQPVESYAAATATDPHSLKIGLPKEFYAEGIDPEIAATVRAAATRLEAAGHTLVEVSIPVVAHAISCYYIIAWAEASSNLARFDGIHFGHSILKRESSADDAPASLYEVYAASRSAGFSAETKRRIMLGTYVLSAGYYDAFYRKALKVRTAIVRGFADAFTQADVLLAPVSPVLPFHIGEKSADPLAMYMADILTAPINPAGVPSLALPAGLVERDGVTLPVGMQLIGPQFSESRLLALGAQYQRLDTVYQQHPTL